MARFVRLAVVGWVSLAIAAVVLVLILEPWAAVDQLDRTDRVPPISLQSPPLDNEITFRTAVAAERRRDRLRRFVFGRAGVPTRLPTVESGVEDAEFIAGLSNLRRIDQLTIALPRGFSAVVYYVPPTQANGRLLIYHNGHDQDFFDGKDTVAYFLERGYAVLVFAMPYASPDGNPDTFETPLCGQVELIAKTHESLACMPRPLRYFLEPVAVAINYANRLGYAQVDMIGLSGGGWTTVLYAALDQRVQRSYPVAGSAPHEVRVHTCGAVVSFSLAALRGGDLLRAFRDCGHDFEQAMPTLYRIANYEELYALGSWGPGRKQLAVYNAYEACCVGGFGGRYYLSWTPRVQAAVRRLGAGSYASVGDGTHTQHVISPFALRLIEDDLEAS